MKKAALFMIAVMVMTALVGCSSGPEKEKVTAKVIDIELTQELYAFGVDKDQPELLEQVNAFIAQIKADGTFEEICNRYFGDGTPVDVKSCQLDESKDQLLVATHATFEPFEYTAGDSYRGVDMEMAKLLADHLGKELVIVDMEFSAVCLSVGQHKCDIAMAGLTIKEERKEYVNFTDSYYNAAQKLVVRSDDTTFDNCKSADDVVAILKGFDKSVKMGTQTGTTGMFYVEGKEDWGFEGFNVTDTVYSNSSLAIQDMLNGNIQYVVIDSAPAKCVSEKLNALIK